jgi:hypothetical protein
VADDLRETLFLSVFKESAYHGNIEATAAANVFEIAGPIDGDHAKAGFAEKQFPRFAQTFRRRDDQNLLGNRGHD